MYISNDDFFNENTINIFCDCSFDNYTANGLYGIILIKGKINNNENIEYYYRGARYENSNRLELLAIILAINIYISKYINYPIINIFSDYLYGINIIREDFYTKWKYKEEYNLFVNKYTGKIYANHDLYLQINHMIKYINHRINIYMINSHININNKLSIILYNFKIYNFIQNYVYIPYELIIRLLNYNNIIDRYLRYSIRNYRNNHIYFNEYIYPIIDIYNKDIDKNVYNLIYPKKIL